MCQLPRLQISFTQRVSVILPKAQSLDKATKMTAVSSSRNLARTKWKQHAKLYLMFLNELVSTLYLYMYCKDTPFTSRDDAGPHTRGPSLHTSKVLLIEIVHKGRVRVY